ncbi:hypothetical protein Tco_1409273 [Tanacetum coccineum]
MCSSQKGKQKVVEDIGIPNSKSKKGTSKKSQSPKSPIATPNADVAHKACSFRLWAGWMQSEASFQIKTLVLTHTCSKNFSLGSLVTYKWIAMQFAVEVLKNPKISYRHTVADVREKFFINDYKDEILSTNPGSTVQLDVDTMDDGKTYYESELLTAMGRDSNNQMFPMAWAVVSIENSENWLWFLSHLGSDFNLAMGAYLTILSDGHKGLIEAVKELLPHAEHRLCARHIYANFKKKWNGLHYKSLFWGAAASTLVVHFKHKMELIKNIDPLAYNWLMERDPKAWCRAYFQMDRSCAAFENGLWKLNMIIVCPAIRKELEKLKKYQRYWMVVPCGQELFEVRKADEGFGVNLNTKTCTCKRWDLFGIPCIHAVAAYSLLNQDPSKGVSSWYSKQMWVNAYSHFIKPVGGPGKKPDTAFDVSD